MIPNETTIHQRLSEVDVSNYQQLYSRQKFENPIHFSRQKQPLHEKYESSSEKIIA